MQESVNYCRKHRPIFNYSDNDGYKISMDGVAPLFQTVVSEKELEVGQEEFEIQNLNLSEDDCEGRVPIRTLSDQYSFENRFSVNNPDEERVFSPNDISINTGIWRNNDGEIVHFHMNMFPRLGVEEQQALCEDWNMSGGEMRNFVRAYFPELRISPHGLGLLINNQAVAGASSQDFSSVVFAFDSSDRRVSTWAKEMDRKIWYGVGFESDAGDNLLKIGFGVRNFNFQEIEDGVLESLSGPINDIESVRELIDIGVFSDA